MKKISDELINKYLDGELSGQELREFNELLQNDEEALNKLKVHKYVDETLRDIPVEKAPDNIKLSVMQKLKPNFKAKKLTNSFFYAVVGIFSVMILGILGYALKDISFAGGDSMITERISESVNKLLSGKLDSVMSLFTSNEFMLAGASVTLILLLVTYFIFESHKDVLKRLDKSKS